MAAAPLIAQLVNGEAHSSNTSTHASLFFNLRLDLGYVKTRGSVVLQRQIALIYIAIEFKGQFEYHQPLVLDVRLIP